MIDFAFNGARWTAAADRVIDGITYDRYTRIDNIVTLDGEDPLLGIRGEYQAS